MILRNVTYSDQHHVLPGAEIAVLNARPADMVPPPLVEVASAEVLVRPEPPLTLEQVSIWLASQDADVRSQLAKQLDDEIHNLRARAAEEGQATGARVAAQEIHDQFEKSLQTLRVLATEAELLFSKQRDSLARHSVAVVDAALAKLLGKALSEPGVSMGAVQQAITHLAGSRSVTIRVSEAELSIIAMKRTEIAEALGDDTFKLVADSRVASGGCLIESSFGDIDARWETQLTALIKTLQSHASAPSDHS